ncbi:hypothetical protein MO973_43830 [Paenibacillus sp. TRM 82003]|nr:hypothetical protein [Paenibacillus sp. TRM 82003]
MTPQSILLIGAALLIGALVLLLRSGSNADAPEARAAADAFYAYERTGDFGSSWELFHPYMKTKFNKDAYIQTRAHVFMQDFGVSTFEVDVGEPHKLDSWRMAPDLPALPSVYRLPVRLTYESKFGVFHIEQEVFMALERGEWLLLWAYPLD